MGRRGNNWGREKRKEKGKREGEKKVQSWCDKAQVSSGQPTTEGREQKNLLGLGGGERRARNTGNKKKVGVGSLIKKQVQGIAPKRECL